jgi:hypothetical protein
MSLQAKYGNVVEQTEWLYFLHVRVRSRSKDYANLLQHIRLVFWALISGRYFAWKKCPDTQLAYGR